MADHLVSLIGESTKATPEQLDPFRRVLAARCTQDQWSAQAQQCMLDSKTLDDGDKCEPLFTPQQKEALQRDGETALGVLKQAPPAGAPAGAPAEGAAPPSPTRGSHRAGDPCEGGE